jgi:hypothetical protein
MVHNKIFNNCSRLGMMEIVPVGVRERINQSKTKELLFRIRLCSAAHSP